MHIRLKLLRKTLGLTQSEFGNKLGLVQQAIAMMENGKRDINERQIKAICSIFNVDENWFRTGEGGEEVVFIQNVKNALDELTREYNLSEYGRKAIECYLNMDEAQRTIIDNYLKSFADSMNKPEPTEPEEQSETTSIADDMVNTLNFAESTVSK